jgi:hypothetical protein
MLASTRAHSDRNKTWKNPNLVALVLLGYRYNLLQTCYNRDVIVSAVVSFLYLGLYFQFVVPSVTNLLPSVTNLLPSVIGLLPTVTNLLTCSNIMQISLRSRYCSRWRRRRACSNMLAHHMQISLNFWKTTG